ncbi:MAG TPA: DNA mismatch repair protein MutS [Polyangiaceae bacterium]|nr:DNA mismatch repair protein MutS [Polyangiaceae bacterium]
MTAASQPSDATAPERHPYTERATRFERLAAAHGSRSRLVSNLRGLAFGTSAVALLLATLGGQPAGGPVSAIAAVCFVGLIMWHSRVIAREDDALRLARVNIDARARVTGEWHALPDDGARFIAETHPYAADLDLFGKGSVYQRINVAHTRFGQDAMARFLSNTAEPDAIRARQEAAQALSPLLEERQKLEALSIAVVEPPPSLANDGRPTSTTKPRPIEPPDPEPLLAWAEREPWLSKRTALIATLYVLPVLTLGLMFLARPVGLPGTAWLLPFIGELIVVAQVKPQADAVFAAVSSTQGAFLRYGPMFELIESLKLPSRLLADLRQGLVSSEVSPSASMKRFERIVSYFELRHGGIIHLFANAFLLWDAHCLLRLEGWQKDAGRHARAWFRTLGEVEALSAFAGLSYDEPGFIWPEIVEGPACFEATELAHPLLPATSRIANDVSLPEPGRALLVTGSNMSGKSTLLRSMGTAAAMALSGAPVCAARFRLSPLVVRTSLKISDSLARGVSHFYAEVSRLKAAVDATEGDTPVLFLLDEILHGTNSEERQIGARWILAELLRRGAIGAVSTHDIGLCRLPDALMARVTQCHFRENVEGGRMTFDYRLRTGPVSGGNALRLMRLVGLAVPVDGSV